MLAGQSPVIYGDGETSRDFCHVDNVVQANLLACMTQSASAMNQIYNVAVGERHSLNDLFRLMRTTLAERYPDLARLRPVFGDFRSADVRHTQADIGKARRLLGYDPVCRLDQGLRASLDWYVAHLRPPVPSHD
jgi:UDP-N-acetylglucosamine 4-epimerase